MVDNYRTLYDELLQRPGSAVHRTSRDDEAIPRTSP
jgi:hypothetical protein